MLYPDSHTRQLLVREHQAELRRAYGPSIPAEAQTEPPPSRNRRSVRLGTLGLLAHLGTKRRNRAAHV